ncbi:unnamed protein product [Rotaria socialis]|uniref:Uncharacterized protein n=1 Tax=Rotaria socialis TaxID=392032 RepID=A0A820UZU9_9BILA|nr:unnamed protein product [Rotaria socialis]
MSTLFSEWPPAFSHTFDKKDSISNRNTDSIDTNASTLSSNRYSTVADSKAFSATPKNGDEQKSSDRFYDMASVPRRILLPIQGFEKMPLVSLIPDVEQMVWIAEQNCSKPKDGLTNDAFASIMLYTM